MIQIIDFLVRGVPWMVVVVIGVRFGRRIVTHGSRQAAGEMREAMSAP
jgi:hypothetical protein